MDIINLVNLTSRRWSLPILVQLHRGILGRQADLIAHTGSGRTALRASLQYLVEIGIVVRNSGHGHPLRAEYCLTDNGIATAKFAHDLWSKLERAEEYKLAQRNWSLPTLAILSEQNRFGEIRAQLGGITDRALSHTLKGLVQINWVRRQVDIVSHPPIVTYQAQLKGAAIARTCIAA